VMKVQLFLFFAYIIESHPVDLELTFYHNPVVCRSTSPFPCSHDIFRDHTRFFRFQRKIIKFEYEAIDLVEVAVPPLVLKLVAEPNSRYKNADLDELRDSINAYYDSLTHRIEVICNNYNGPLLLLPVPKALACREIMVSRFNRRIIQPKYS
jgi:hypothetical protein